MPRAAGISNSSVGAEPPKMALASHKHGVDTGSCPPTQRAVSRPPSLPFPQISRMHSGINSRVLQVPREAAGHEGQAT